jgi:transposase-like protein
MSSSIKAGLQLLLVSAAVLAVVIVNAADDVSDYKPARALLQSGTSCPTQIPGCLARRCTTRTVDSVKDRYVCLRCKSGFSVVLSTNKKSIIQCSEHLAKSL